MIFDKIKEIRAAMEQELQEAASSEQLRDLKVNFLGKKGSISEISKSMGKLSPEERPKAGQLVNELRQALEQNLARRQQELADKALQAQLAKEAVDVTLPGQSLKLGSKHPLTLVMDEFKEIFLGMGYTILSISTQSVCCVRTLRRCRLGLWTGFILRCRLRLFLLVWCIVGMMTPLIPQCFIRWRAWWLVRISL